MIDRFAGTTYEVSGSGPVLVLIHGVGLDRTMWQPLAERLQGRLTIVRYDLGGHGESPALTLGASLDGFAAQLESLLEHLQLQRVALAGFSLGALIAQRFALTRPHMLTHLILISSVFQRRPEQIAAVQSRVSQATDNGPESIVEAAIARWFTPAFIAQAPESVDRVRDRLQRNNRRDFLDAYRIFAEPAWIDHLHQITCPALVTTGALDSGSTPAMTRALASALGNGRSVILPNLAHMAPLEGASRVAELILQFLSEHASDQHTPSEKD